MKVSRMLTFSHPEGTEMPRGNNSEEIVRKNTELFRAHFQSCMEKIMNYPIAGSIHITNKFMSIGALILDIEATEETEFRKYIKNENIGMMTETDPNDIQLRGATSA